jgi:hypothetical protein
MGHLEDGYTSTAEESFLGAVARAALWSVVFGELLLIIGARGVTLGQVGAFWGIQ